ncbi:hypothetical protein Ahy_A09g043582 [Arachis hypogaea]|uniref:Remorin C-terminal domain-containing protein n=1 Tax=Arachis hypogaea TaxID=3818 RepID=A0A445BIM8_ARAHY|nr:hypothetical protein Ahy_A09g043582 [Arachis hypogaea]
MKFKESSVESNKQNQKAFWFDIIQQWKKNEQCLLNRMMLRDGFVAQFQAMAAAATTTETHIHDHNFKGVQNQRVVQLCLQEHHHHPTTRTIHLQFHCAKASCEELDGWFTFHNRSLGTRCSLSLHHFDAHDNDFGHGFDIGNVMQQCFTGAVLNDNNGVLAPMWNQLLCDPSSPNSQDENPKNEETPIMSPFSRRDQGTQMSPPESESDANSSSISAMDQKNGYSGIEVRDVEVDSKATVIRWPKGHATKLTSFQESNSEIQTSCSDIAKSTMDITKIQKEEAKIVAWESQQKAKAEATIRKLEVSFQFIKICCFEVELSHMECVLSSTQYIYTHIYYDKISKQARH